MRGRVYIRETIMKIKHIACLISLGLALPTFAAENIDLDNVVVTATRTPQPREALIADVSVIEAEEIKRGGQTTLVELLQQQPGIEINNNGGPGKTSGIFMRGTNSNHVVVVIDGMRIQSATAGTTTFENLPLSQIDRIEILRGPASSLYGQDAIGGVIQIFTKKGIEGFKPYVSLGIGSYATTIAEAGVRGKWQDTSYAFNVSATDIGGFSALKTKNSNLKDDDAYRNLAFSANVSQKLAEGHEMGIQFLNSDGVTRFDNRFNGSNFSSKARIEQQSVALFSNNQLTSFWLSKLRVGESQDNSKTFDQFSLPAGDRFNTKQEQINWQNDFALPVGTLTLMYDRLNDEVDSNTNFDKTNRTNEGYVASYLANIGAHNVQLSYRDDHNSQFGNNQTGGLGYGYRFNKNWKATASYGSAFKAPSFNDLYFPGFSNPNLAPEKSDNIEASLRYQDDKSEFSVTAFDNRIRNLIGFDLTTFTVENIKKARIQGITIAGGHQVGNLQMNANIDFQSPRDEQTDRLLVRRANRHANLNLAYSLGDWRFGAEMVASSNRYNDPNNKLSMGGYSIINFTTQYKVNSDWSVQARANNVFDKNYALALDGNPATTGYAYNTPGANLFVNVRYEP